MIRPLEIPPRYNCYLYRAMNTGVGPDWFYRVIFTSDLEHAQRFIMRFSAEQGTDLDFRFVAALSLSDVDVLFSEYNQCVLAL